MRVALRLLLIIAFWLRRTRSPVVRGSALHHAIAILVVATKGQRRSSPLWQCGLALVVRLIEVEIGWLHHPDVRWFWRHDILVLVLSWGGVHLLLEDGRGRPLPGLCSQTGLRRL